MRPQRYHDAIGMKPRRGQDECVQAAAGAGERDTVEGQMRLVEDGADPMNTFRDPTENEVLYTFDEYRAPGARPENGLLQLGGAFMSVPMSGERDPETGRHVRSLTGRYSPIAFAAEEIFAQARRQAAPPS